MRRSILKSKQPLSKLLITLLSCTLTHLFTGRCFKRLCFSFKKRLFFKFRLIKPLHQLKRFANLLIKLVKKINLAFFNLQNHDQNGTRYQEQIVLSVGHVTTTKNIKMKQQYMKCCVPIKEFSFANSNNELQLYKKDIKINNSIASLLICPL